MDKIHIITLYFLAGMIKTLLIFWFNVKKVSKKRFKDLLYFNNKTKKDKFK